MSPATILSPPVSPPGPGQAPPERSVSDGGRSPAQPPVCNTGVYPSARSNDFKQLHHRFDFYRATVPAHPETVLHMLAQGLLGHGVETLLGQGRARFNFTSNSCLLDDRGMAIVEVLHGGCNRHPCVEVSGSWSPILADIIRASGFHLPSRVDACCDMRASGLFADLVAWSSPFARERDIRRKLVSDDDPDAGDTIYLGSRNSQAFVRIYQPGLKRAAEEGRFGDQITQAERDTVRVELEFKPDKRPAKAAAARLSASDLWGVSPWIRALANHVFAMDVEPTSISDRRESDQERALRFMASQYRAHLESLLRACEGDLSEFGAAIADLAGIGPDGASRASEGGGGDLGPRR